MNWIYHLTSQAAWDLALAEGVYRPDSLTSEGFIHASTDTQLEASANRHFAGTHRLILLKIEVARLQPTLVWEVSPHAATLFPHLYGPLNPDAVCETFIWDRSRDGIFRQPFGD